MSSEKKPDVVKVYQLKVTLRHITPLIWRRLLVKSDTTIAQMHSILQIAMGWEDLHLHKFRVHGKEYGIYRDCGIWFADDPHQVRLRDFKLRKGERFLYEYDMGDWWLHDIRLELVLPLEPRKKYPVCTEGDGDCPPEDCGGPSGFLDLMEERDAWSELQQVREDMLLVDSACSISTTAARVQPTKRTSSWKLWSGCENARRMRRSPSTAAR